MKINLHCQSTYFKKVAKETKADRKLYLTTQKPTKRNDLL